MRNLKCDKFLFKQVGVVDAQGRHVLIDKGPLPEAVAASAAIPLIFEGVHIPGGSAAGSFTECSRKIEHNKFPDY
jgi:predicted acylesterase/phospholipase RssA